MNRRISSLGVERPRLAQARQALRFGWLRDVLHRVGLVESARVGPQQGHGRTVRGGWHEMFFSLHRNPPGL
jgi:hypothetical protein